MLTGAASGAGEGSEASFGPPARGQTRLGVALIGVGRWGQRLLPHLLRRFDVQTCCSLGSPATRRWLEQNHPTLRYTSQPELAFTDERIDAVVIATPLSTHARLARDALVARKHVFVEKPLADSLDRAKEVLQLSRTQGRAVFVGHTYLYHQAFLVLRALTRDDPVVRASLLWAKLGTFDSDPLWNLVSHDVAIVTELFGERPVGAETLSRLGLRTECDSIVARLTFSGGRRALIQVERCTPVPMKTVTVVTASGVTYSWCGDRLHVFSGGRPVELELPRRDAIGAELDDFQRAVGGNGGAGENAELGLSVVETLSRLQGAVAA